jgi:hypothetical protein
MTTAEMHALSVAVEERYAELNRYREWFATNPIGQGWTDLAEENRIRLNELGFLLLEARQTARTEGESRVMVGDR